MKVISWNVAGRTSRAVERAERLCAHNPDVVGLQEVTEKAFSALSEGLISCGLKHHVYAKNIAANPRKRRCVAVFSRWPIQTLTNSISVPYPELVLSVMVQQPELPFEFHCVHIPNGREHGWEKIESFEGVYRGLASTSDIPRILCGDFNSPKEELPTGEIVPWSRRDERWADGELSVISGLAKFGLEDVYRQQHGYPLHSFSWYAKNGTRRRFDHIFASRSLRVSDCDYVQDWRQDGLSDHSGIEAVFSAC